jgi:maltose alpha-D-glucosyltransferase/alpha-amylase
VLNSAAVVDPETQNEDIAEALAGYGNFAAAIGRRLGELHAILAAPTDNPAFAPEKATAADGAVWAEAVRAQLEAALAALRGVADWHDEESQQAATLVKERRPALNKTIDRLTMAAVESLKTRTHGDFHLGQVLVSSGDAFIIDFEGEPARPLEERRAKSSPLRDVAGLLRSFDYAVAAASSRAEGPAQNAPGKATVLDRFAANASEAFLAAYREVHAESPWPWVTEASEAALLDLFLIEKAAYEICYEAANRPAWIGIPLHGLERISARLAAPVMEPADG